MATLIALSDLPKEIRTHEQADMWLAGANASAVRVAPCLASTDPPPTQDQLDEAKLVLVGTVIRWYEAGAGALRSKRAGPFSEEVDTRVKTGYNMWPSEIERLKDICRGGKSGRAFGVDTAPQAPSMTHLPWCSVMFKAKYCSCGADIAGRPIYERG